MSEIIFETKNNLGKIILNRPQALNALSRDMFLPLKKQLIEWSKNPEIKAVLMRSACEKAYCAGGDIRALYDNRNKTVDEMAHYFELEYSINKIIFHYPKPLIALTHGITMGGGVGISAHASHCVAAENLRWAMPETMIGFFPDVGATYYLSRLPNAVGTYLALTGTTIDASQALHLKLIKAVVLQKNFDYLENKITETQFDSTDFQSVTNIINQFSENDNQSTLPIEKIAHCFCFLTIDDIINALKIDHSDWAQASLNQLLLRSPTSLHVTLKQLQLAKNKTFDEVMAMDFHIARAMLMHHDFFEGIRAAIIDKDKNPKWETVGKIVEYF